MYFKVKERNLQVTYVASVCIHILVSDLILTRVQIPNSCYVIKLFVKCACWL